MLAFKVFPQLTHTFWWWFTGHVNLAGSRGAKIFGQTILSVSVRVFLDKVNI